MPAQEAKDRPRATAPGSAAGHGLVAKKATTSEAAASEASASATGRDTADSAAPAGRRGAPSPKGWWDVGQGHGGEEAWAMGFKGEGVTAAVLDTGVDFGHPDLQGAWQVYPAGHTYAGWPEALDPDGLVRYMLDATDDSDDPVETASGNGGVIALHQASPVTTEDLGGELVHTACVTPVTVEDDGGDIVRSDGEEDCDTVVPASAGGTIRYGHHPDVFLGLLRRHTRPAIHHLRDARQLGQPGRVARPDAHQRQVLAARPRPAVAPRRHHARRQRLRRYDDHRQPLRGRAPRERRDTVGDARMGGAGGLGREEGDRGGVGRGVRRGVGVGIAMDRVIGADDGLPGRFTRP